MAEQGLLEKTLTKIIADNDGVDVSVVDREYVQKSLRETADQLREQAIKDGKRPVTQDKIRNSAQELSEILAPTI